MEDTKIVKHFTKFFYPFKFSKGQKHQLDKTILSAKGKELKVWQRSKVDASELREGVSDFFSDREGDCSARIADCFSLNTNCRAHFDLPRREAEQMGFFARPSGVEKPFSVAISDVRLFLFESEVGFVEVTCEYGGSGISDYIDCNYFLSEIKSEKNYFSYKKRDSSQEFSEVKFSMAELIQRVLGFVGGVKFFDATSDGLSLKKLIVYSFVLLEKKPEDLQSFLFWARKNYKLSYKPPTNEYYLLNNPNIFEAFENSFWGTSFNGAVNISFLTGDKVTDDFFLTQFPVKLNSTYLHLFLSVLHQKFAMRSLTAKMGCLDKIVKNYSVMKTQLKEANDCRAEAASLKFRAFFEVPSDVEHLNKYYKLLSSTYEIATIFENFNKDISNLVSICDSYVEKIKNRDKNIQTLKKEKVEIFVSVVGTLVAVATLFNSSWGILEKVFGKQLDFFTPQVLITFATMLVPLITIAVNVFNRVTEIRKISKSLKSEMEKGEVEPDKERKKAK